MCHLQNYMILLQIREYDSLLMLSYTSYYVSTSSKLQNNPKYENQKQKNTTENQKTDTHFSFSFDNFFVWK